MSPRFSARKITTTSILHRRHDRSSLIVSRKQRQRLGKIKNQEKSVVIKSIKEKRENRMIKFLQQREVAEMSILPDNDYRVNENDIDILFRDEGESNLALVSPQTVQKGAHKQENDSRSLIIALDDGKIPKTTENFNKLLGLYANSKRNSSSAFRYFEWMQLCGVTANEETYLHLLKVCGISGDCLTSERIIDNLIQENYSPPIAYIHELARSYINNSSRWKDANNMIQLALDTDNSPDSKLFAIIAEGHFRHGDYDAVFRLHDEMMVNYCDAEEEMLNLLIKVCMKKRMPERALDIYNEFEINALQPSVTTFNSLIYCCGLSWKFKYKAFDFLDEMRSQGVAPNLDTYNALIKACAIDGDLRRSKALFNALQTSHDSMLLPSEETYAAMFDVIAGAVVRKKIAPNDRNVPRIPDDFIQIEKFPTMFDGIDEYGGYGEDGLQLLRDSAKINEFESKHLDFEDSEINDGLLHNIATIQDAHGDITSDQSLQSIFNKNDGNLSDKISIDQQKKEADENMLKISTSQMSFSEAIAAAESAARSKSISEADSKNAQVSESENSCKIEKINDKSKVYSSSTYALEMVASQKDTKKHEIMVTKSTEDVVQKKHNIHRSNTATAVDLWNNPEAICHVTEQQKNLDYANQLFDAFLSTGHKPSQRLISSYIKVHANSKRIQSAIASFEYFEKFNVPVPVQAYASIISMYSDIRRPIDALAWKKRVDSKTQLVLASPVYGKLIRACTRHNMIDEAITLLKDIKVKNLKPPEEKYLVFLRKKLKELRIWTDYLPIDKKAWHRRSMVQAHKKKGSARRNKLQNIQSIMRA